ncbi:MAG: alanine racemase [Bacteroidales bacterium]|nr:alanine racemase [Bacteroidales bacterium]
MSFLDHIKTPTLLLDEQKCLDNIRRMADKARRNNLIFRPHFKSHQSAAIGEWYREEGVTAITVSSVEMAGYFADAGWNDITIAFPVNLLELNDIERLAGKIHLNLLVNFPDIIPVLDNKMTNPVGIFIEIDTGYHRSGLTLENINLIETIINGCKQSHKLDFKGFLSHFGESYQASNPDEIEKIFYHGVRELQQIKRSLHPGQAGLISVGDTPTCSVADDFQGVDEIRPGNYLFYDVMQLEIGACATDQIALCLAAPVVDLYPARNEVVVYAGAIHLSKERLRRNGEEIFGLVVRLTNEGWTKPLEGCSVTQLSQEHGVLQLDPDTLNSLKPGSLIGILPVHACLTADSMKKYMTIQGKPVSMFTGI